MSHRTTINYLLSRLSAPLFGCLCFLVIVGLGSSSFSWKNSPDEICDNALDDDGDGLIDLNDPDCNCPILEPVSLIPNPSFEEMNCCPQSRSELDCADTWIQASGPTTDFLHTCGWLGWPDFPPPLPFPDGEGVMGFRDGRVRNNTAPEVNWKEYAGACLLNPLRANTSYRFSFFLGFVDPDRSPPINVTFFGTPNCMNLPFGGLRDDFGCPTNDPDWVELGFVSLRGDRWVQAEVSFTPDQDIYAIVIGPPCVPTSAERSTYYFFDNLVLADERAFDFKITTIGNSCDKDYSFEVPLITDKTYQWYKDGIALIGETNPQIEKLYGEGEYQVRILGNNSCNLSRIYAYDIPLIENSIEQTICEGTTYQLGQNSLSQAGNYTDTLSTADGCDSIVNLQLRIQGDQLDTITASIFEGETFQIGKRKFRHIGDYELALTSSQGCDSLVLLRLDHYQIYIPNVFSPNGDGYNDVFSIFGGADLVEIQSLQIFSRWGALLYDGQQLSPNNQEGWDGRHQNELLDAGVYVYLAKVRMNDGQLRSFSGALTLVH